MDLTVGFLATGMGAMGGMFLRPFLFECWVLLCAYVRFVEKIIVKDTLFFTCSCLLCLFLEKEFENIFFCKMTDSGTFDWYRLDCKALENSVTLLLKHSRTALFNCCPAETSIVIPSWAGNIV